MAKRGLLGMKYMHYVMRITHSLVKHCQWHWMSDMKGAPLVHFKRFLRNHWRNAFSCCGQENVSLSGLSGILSAGHCFCPMWAHAEVCPIWCMWLYILFSENAHSWYLCFPNIYFKYQIFANRSPQMSVPCNSLRESSPPILLLICLACVSAPELSNLRTCGLWSVREGQGRCSLRKSNFRLSWTCSDSPSSLLSGFYPNLLALPSLPTKSPPPWDPLQSAQAGTPTLQISTNPFTRHTAPGIR